MLKTNHDVIKDKVRFFNFLSYSINVLVNFSVNFSPRNKILDILICPLNGLFKNLMNLIFRSKASWEIDKKQSGNSFLRHPVYFSSRWPLIDQTPWDVNCALSIVNDAYFIIYCFCYSLALRVHHFAGNNVAGTIWISPWYFLDFCNASKIIGKICFQKGIRFFYS